MELVQLLHRVERGLGDPHLGTRRRQHLRHDLARPRIIVHDEDPKILERAEFARPPWLPDPSPLVSSARMSSSVSSCVVMSGSVTENVAPLPARHSPRRPFRRAPPRGGERSPAPGPTLRRPAWFEPSSCENRLNTCGKNSGAMPMPVSLTVRSARPWFSLERHGHAPAFGRELERIGEQVRDDLLKPRRITGDPADGLIHRELRA